MRRAIQSVLTTLSDHQPILQPGQAVHWRSVHKKMCKRFKEYMSSSRFTGLSHHQQYDALLLSHLVATQSTFDPPYSSGAPQARTFLSLLATSNEGLEDLDVLLPTPSPPPTHLQELYSRFGNNNFSIHSHLNTIGHGVFPLASRLFNHSCVPNAAAKFVLSATEPPTMEVVALRDIKVNEEVSHRHTLSDVLADHLHQP